MSAARHDRMHPMETAPRDGTRFYGRVDIDGGEYWIPGVYWKDGAWWHEVCRRDWADEDRRVTQELLEWAR